MSGLTIGHNLGAMSALDALNTNSSALNSALQKLSTGKRINSAADDASGYAISQEMQSQINGLDQASSNAQDGISMLQTASGALNETNSILQQMRQLATQAANDTNTTSDRQNIQQEINQLTDEINRIANTTQYNTQNLLQGKEGSSAISGASYGSTGFSKLASGADSANALVSGDQFSLTVSSSVGLSGSASGGDVSSVSLGSSSKLSTNTTYDVIISGNTTSGFTAQLANASGTALAGVSSVTVSTSGGTGISLGDGVTVDISSLSGLSGSATTTFSTGGLSYAGTLKDTSTQTTIASDVTLSTGSAVTFGSTGLTFDTASTIATGSASFTYNDAFNASLQIGANEGQNMTISIANMNAVQLGIASSATGSAFTSGKVITNGANDNAIEYALNVTTASGASNAINVLDNAIGKISQEQGNLGAYQNRLQHTINNLTTASQNLTSAESGITDTNMAKEMAQFTKDNVLQQAAVSMLAQANQQPQLVLKLLG